MIPRITDTVRDEFGLIGRNSRARTWTYMSRGTEARSMKRLVVLTTAMLVVAAMMGGVGAVAGATADAGSATQGPLSATDDTSNETTANETTNETDGTTEEPSSAAEGDSDSDIPPGARLAGVVGSEKAEQEAAVESRAFEKAFVEANSNGSKAAVVARSTERIEERIQVLENESARLEAEYEAGNVSNGTYQARMTSLTARITALEHQANQTSAKSKTLPAAALEARGLNQTHVESLENRTRNATNPRAAEIAQRVAGPQVGQPSGPPEGVPGHAQGGPGNGNGQSAVGQSESKGQASGQNGSANGSTTQNATPQSMANQASGSVNDEAKNRSNGSVDDGTPGQQTWFEQNDTRERGSSSNSPGGPNASDHPVFGNASAVEFVLGFLG